MATYCIGDLHGCRDEFLRLLDTLKFSEKSDEIILTGDLIGRGPLPVETMKEIFKLGKAVKSVLGNHDLHFLCVHYGVVKPKLKDNLDVILKSDMRDEIVHYLLKTPLMHLDKDKHLCVTHAGLYPKWTLKAARREAREIKRVFKDPLKRMILLRNMYSDQPDCYDKRNLGLARWRFALNAFTRMRLVNAQMVLDYKNSAVSPELVASQGLTPWFDVIKPLIYQEQQYTLAFGHWAALNGKCTVPYVKALDTGCIWGDRLSAWCLETDKFVSVKSVGYAQI